MLHHDRLRAALDIAIAIAALFGARALARALELGLYGGPIATVIAVGVATLLLRRRGSGWRELGASRPASWRASIAWAVGLAVACLVASPLVVAVVDHLVALPPQDLSRFAALKGDTLRYLIMLVPVAWGAAAFGEELLYRGFLLRRAMALFGGETAVARATAALAQAALFGAMHAYLGPRGMLNAGVVGVLSAAAYFANGRNLWALFLAHGLIDTLGITLLYLGIGHAG